MKVCLLLQPLSLQDASLSKLHIAHCPGEEVKDAGGPNLPISLGNLGKDREGWAFWGYTGSCSVMCSTKAHGGPHCLYASMSDEAILVPNLSIDFEIEPMWFKLQLSLKARLDDRKHFLKWSRRGSSWAQQLTKTQNPRGPRTEKRQSCGLVIRNPDSQGGEYCVEIFKENYILGLRKVWELLKRNSVSLVQ